jgi:hypothetical protein
VGLILPEELATKKLTGEVKFLRTNNAKIDVIHILNNEKLGSIAFPGDKFIRGNSRFKTKLVADGITYYWDRNYIH